MNTLKDVKLRMRALAGDPDGEWLTDAYVIPIVNHVYELQVNYLTNTCSKFLEQVRVLPNVEAGASDFGKYQTDPGKPLFGLWQPYREGIDWKQAGQPDNYYQPAFRAERLPDLSPTGSNNRMWWEWRGGNTLFITPMAFAVDIRVRGDFFPPPLAKDEDAITIHPRMAGTLAEEANACAWRERQNPGQLGEYKLVFTAALDDIANQLIRGQQSTPLRVARAASRHRSGC